MRNIFCRAKGFIALKSNKLDIEQKGAFQLPSAIFILLLSANSSVYAESRVLPPVIDNSSYQNSSAGMGGGTANAMYEVLGRLEQMQLEIQQLRGLVEEQSQTIIDLKKRQSNIYSDLDLRIQELTNVTQNTQAAKAQMLAEATALAKAKLKSEVVTAKVVNQKELYQAAYETLRNGHNTRAISAFKSLLVKFPKGEYADNSQYWLGEAYKVNQDINSAKAAFVKVTTDFPMSPKIPDALLKLGYIELEQNNRAKARDYLTQITVNHPGTTAAHLAAKKLLTMQP